MPTDRFIYGAGGHAKVVLDAVQCRGEQVRLFDGNPERAGDSLLGHLIEYAKDPITLPPLCHLAIGDNAVRARLLDQLSPYTQGWFSVIHPHATVATSAELEPGIFIAAQAVVGPQAQIATACIINHGAVVDHDCRIGRVCHIAPNATLGGSVVLGEGVLVGSGAILLPGVKIGNNARIGSGAVVIREVHPNTTVIGIPARVKE